MYPSKSSAGETVALVGATGAGKSSVINLLNRFYEIDRGKILVDGVNIDEYDMGYLRRNIGVVLQDVFLFQIRFLTTSRWEIQGLRKRWSGTLPTWWAPENLSSDFLESLSYNVMERGATLSVGQRQLISFIRAMVFDPKILVLDEATSSVDSETEEMIQQAILKMMNGRTSIVIAHRLSTIQKADKIIVLDHGEVKESGTHEALLAHEGFYAQLHKMQYKEFV